MKVPCQLRSWQESGAATGWAIQCSVFLTDRGPGLLCWNDGSAEVDPGRRALLVMQVPEVGGLKAAMPLGLRQCGLHKLGKIGLQNRHVSSSVWLGSQH